MKRALKIEGRETCKLINLANTFLIDIEHHYIKDVGDVVAIRVWNENFMEPFVGFLPWEEFHAISNWLTRDYIRGIQTIYALDLIGIMITGNKLWKEVEKDEPM